MCQEHIIQRKILKRFSIPTSPNYWSPCTISCNVSIHVLLHSKHLHNKNLLRYASHAPIVFTTFFSVPKIRFHRVGKAISGVEFTYLPMSGWNLSNASSYSCPFLLSAAKYGKICRSTPPLEQSVFGNDTWIALYRVADYALSNYRRGGGLSNRDGLTKSTRDDLLLVARMSVQLFKLRKSGP